MPPISADAIARIVELRQAGRTVAHVAEVVGVSPRTVSKYGGLRQSRRGRPTGRQFYDDPRFDHPPEDEYADVVPIPFFPADLPRLIPDPFGWTRAELHSALVYAQKKEPIMYVEASKLRLINIGQLIEVVSQGTVTMGKLERVKRNESGKVTLRISGDSVCVDESQQVNIRRSAELYEMHQTSLAVDDLVETGVGAQ